MWLNTSSKTQFQAKMSVRLDDWLPSLALRMSGGEEDQLLQLADHLRGLSFLNGN